MQGALGMRGATGATGATGLWLPNGGVGLRKRRAGCFGPIGKFIFVVSSRVLDVAFPIIFIV